MKIQQDDTWKNRFCNKRCYKATAGYYRHPHELKFPLPHDGLLGKGQNLSCRGLPFSEFCVAGAHTWSSRSTAWALSCSSPRFRSPPRATAREQPQRREWLLIPDTRQRGSSTLAHKSQESTRSTFNPDFKRVFSSYVLVKKTKQTNNYKDKTLHSINFQCLIFLSSFSRSYIPNEWLQRTADTECEKDTPLKSIL